MSPVLAATKPDLDRDHPRAVSAWSPACSPRARWLLAWALSAAGFGALLAWAPIPTQVQGDSCQILLAVDRMSLGLGPTTIYPRVPQVDWGLITHWPLGYPLLIWVVKVLTGLPTVTACQVVNVTAFALALIGWTAWFRRCLPASYAAALLAATAGLLALVPSHLWDLNTDMILVAFTPLLLMRIDHLVRETLSATETSPAKSLAAFTLWGLLAGALCWIRYSAVYLVIGIALFLLVTRLGRRGLGLAYPVLFAAGCIVPIGLLILINATWGPSALDRPADGFSLSLHWMWFSQWWHNFSGLPLFDSHWRSPMLWSRLLPLAAALTVLSKPSFRRTTLSFFARPPVLLSLCALVGLLVLLIGFRIVADPLYHPPSEPRYLMPVRPFYLLFVVGPLLCLPGRWIRLLVWPPVLACTVWLIQAGWIDPIILRAAEHKPVTAYGREALPFQAGPDRLYAWLRAQNAPDLIVFSNFYDDLALESHLPAQPLPAHADEMHQRLRQISRARHIKAPRVLFVLEPDNRWRQYFPDLHQALQLFDLQRLNSPDPVLARYVFVPRRLERRDS